MLVGLFDFKEQKMKTPYRKNELFVIPKSKESHNYFCKWFGCRIGKQTIPTGIYLLQLREKQFVFSFQTCAICGREYAKPFHSNEFIQLFREEGSSKWKFIKFDYKADDIISLTKNNDDDEYKAEVRYISHVSEIKNLEYNHVWFNILCSKIGCKYQSFVNEYEIVLIKKCKRCEKFIQEE